MLILIILLALPATLLISGRVCSASTASRIYGSLLAALLLAVSVTLVFGLHELLGFGRVTLWHLVDVAFRSLCNAFPLVFLITYVVMIYARKRGRERSRHAGIMPFAFSSILVFIAMFLLIVGFTSTNIEPNWIEVTHTDIITKKWNKDSPPLRIVQLSDIHVDSFGYRETRTLKLVRRLKPDIILLTGDYANSPKSYPDVRRFMKELHAKYGVYAVYGNRDRGYGFEGIFIGSSVKVIENGLATMNTNSGDVVLGGVPWYLRGNSSSVLSGRTWKNAYTIALSHLPENSSYAGTGVDLVLSGHTHGGQVRIPVVGPVITSTSLPRGQASGLTKLPNGVLLYVNRGIGMEGGYSPRIRFLCRPEIAVFTIRGTRD